MPWAGGAGVAYILLDRFTTDAAAPLTTPRTCEPGPGTLTIVDTNSIISIASSRLVINGTPAANDRVVQPLATTRAAGRAFIIRVPVTPTTITTSGGVRIGLDATANASTLDIGLDFVTAAPPTSYRIKTSNSVVDTLPFPTMPMDVACVMRGTGGFFFVRGGGSGAYTLIWVYNTITSSEFAKIFLNSATADNLALDDFRIVDLGGSFTTDNGIATAVSASPIANETLNCNADCLLEFTWTTPAAAGTIDLQVRRASDTNCWIIRGDQAGSTIKLIEVVASVETERASAAQTWTALTAFRIVITCDTQTIKSYVANVAKNNYASASTQQTTAGAKTTQAGTNFISWPRTVPLPNV